MNSQQLYHHIHFPTKTHKPARKHPLFFLGGVHFQPHHPFNQTASSGFFPQPNPRKKGGPRRVV